MNSKKMKTSVLSTGNLHLYFSDASFDCSLCLSVVMHVVLIPGERFVVVYVCPLFCFSNGVHYSWGKTENCHTYLSFIDLCSFRHCVAGSSLP